jgi:hypothetical protein
MPLLACPACFRTSLAVAKNTTPARTRERARMARS